MTRLILEKELRGTGEDSTETRALARARTLTVLERLNPSRKTSVVLFLTEANLIQGVQGEPTRAICNADDPRGIMQCMNAYSEDLRKKILEALSRGTTKSEAARTFGVSRSSVKRYAKLAEQGLPLAPKKRPGSKPKMDESATKLLETDVQRHPTATLAQRREFLQKVAGVRVSESTISRMLRRLGWSRKKGRWVRARETSS
jgi:transposase